MDKEFTDLAIAKAKAHDASEYIALALFGSDDMKAYWRSEAVNAARALAERLGIELKEIVQ